MPINITDQDQFDATVTSPSNGEQANSASLVNTFVQKLSNRTHYTRRRVPGAASSYELGIPLGRTIIPGGGIPEFAATIMQHFQEAPNAKLIVRVPLPSFGMIQSVRVVWKGNHSGPNLPGTMPRFRFYRSFFPIGAGGGGGLLINQWDTSPNVAAYNQIHNISHTLASPTGISASTAAYTLEIDGEGGANYENDASLLGAFITIIPG
jgi:hypothetical protein